MLPIIVVDQFFKQCRADALRDAAVQLTIDDQRVDHLPAVIRDDVLQHLDLASFPLDFDDGNMRRARSCSPFGIVHATDRQLAKRVLDFKRHGAHVRVVAFGKLAVGQSAFAVACRERALPHADLIFRRIQKRACGLHELFLERLAREHRSASTHHCAATRKSANAVPDGVSVPLNDPHIFDQHPHFIGNDLRERSLKPLPVAGDAKSRSDASGRIHVEVRRFGAGIDRHTGRCRQTRADARQLSKGRDANAEHSTFSVGLRLGFA